MARMLRHKETGEVFIWTSHLSALSELELVVEDPVTAVVAEMAAQTPEEVPEEVPVVELVEIPVEPLVEVPVEAATAVEVPSFSAVKPAVKRRGKAV